MNITVAIPAENKKQETRVAATPETVKKLADLGLKVQIEKGAGTLSSFGDDAFKSAGAKICKDFVETVSKAHVVLCVRPPQSLTALEKDTVLIGLLDAQNNEELIADCHNKKITACAMELLPRITRAQTMDVLSSQSNLAGYKAVLDAAEYFKRAFPMMMTAAGTVPPAKVFVMGAGVAGLQAIATAKRLGAVVSATDVRPAAKEQVESLGANFIAVEDDEFKQAETAGGYAKEMSAAYQKKQQKLIEETIAKQDIVITTALIPGRAAPRLISEAMVKSMKPGAVIVDLAAETGGNCELTKPGEVVHKNDVTIIGHLNVPGRLPTDASRLYAKNLLSLVQLIYDKESKTIKLDWDDEIIQGIALTKDGKIVHPLLTKTKIAPKKPQKKSEPKTKSPKKTSAKKSS